MQRNSSHFRNNEDAFRGNASPLRDRLRRHQPLKLSRECRRPISGRKDGLKSNVSKAFHFIKM